MSELVLTKGMVGERATPSGEAIDRFGTRSQQIVGADGHGEYAELARLGRIFNGGTAAAGMTIITAVGGSISPLAAAATNPILMLINPASSGVDAYLLSTTILSISGTPGAGGLVYNTAVQAAAITGTKTAGRNNKIGGAAGQCYFLSDATATGGVAMTLGRQLYNEFAGAVAATEPTAFVSDERGKICIPQGTSLAIAAVAVGTSWIVSCAFEWAEIPVA